MRPAEERGHLGRHLPRLGVEGLAPAEDEVGAFLRQCQRKRARGAERVGEGEDAIGEVDRPVRSEREALAQRLLGLWRAHRHRDHLAADLLPDRDGMLDRVAAKDVQLERHALTLQRLRLRVELDRREVRDLLDEADDLHWCDPSVRARGALYDIHGNLPALDAVLADAERARRRPLAAWAAITGRPARGRDETLARLQELPNATWIRGNGERWLREPPLDRPEVMEVYDIFRGQVPEEVVEWLYALPTQAELDGILYVHGSPLSDVDSFAPEPQEGEERLLAGVHDRTVVFGHSHQQFRRPGPASTDLVNPGSAGMPLDGDVRAAWATLGRRLRVPPDRVRRRARSRRLPLAGGGDFGEFMARRIERGSD